MSTQLIFHQYLPFWITSLAPLFACSWLLSEVHSIYERNARDSGYLQDSRYIYHVNRNQTEINAVFRIFPFRNRPQVFEAVPVNLIIMSPPSWGDSAGSLRGGASMCCPGTALCGGTREGGPRSSQRGRLVGAEMKEWGCQQLSPQAWTQLNALSVAWGVPAKWTWGTMEPGSRWRA